MNYCLIVFSSFASANRVKNLLIKNFDIKSEIIQTPVGINAKSCSYSLKLRLADMDTAWNIVKQNGLSSKGAYSYESYVKLR